MSIEIPPTNLNDIFEQLLADYNSFSELEYLQVLIVLYSIDNVDRTLPKMYSTIFQILSNESLQSDFGKMIEALVQIGSIEAMNMNVNKSEVKK